GRPWGGGRVIVGGVWVAGPGGPVGVGRAVVVRGAAAVLYGIRRVRPDRRQAWQFGILGGAVALIVVGWLARGPIVHTFNAEGALTYRLNLWQQIVALLPGNTIEGWGWAGRWQTDVPPFLALTTNGTRPASSALNAFLD